MSCTLQCMRVWWVPSSPLSGCFFLLAQARQSPDNDAAVELLETAKELGSPLKDQREEEKDLRSLSLAAVCVLSLSLKEFRLHLCFPSFLFHFLPSSFLLQCATAERHFDAASPEDDDDGGGGRGHVGGLSAAAAPVSPWAFVSVQKQQQRKKGSTVKGGAPSISKPFVGARAPTHPDTRTHTHSHTHTHTSTEGEKRKQFELTLAWKKQREHVQYGRYLVSAVVEEGTNGRAAPNVDRLGHAREGCRHSSSLKAYHSSFFLSLSLSLSL